MIHCTKDGVRIEGSTLDALQDLTNIIKAVKSSLAEDCKEETVNELISLVGQLAYADNKKDETEVVGRMMRVLADEK